MSACKRLYERAKKSPTSLKFREIEKLAGCFGFEIIPARGKGSHKMYTRDGLDRPLDFQNKNGMAKAYQVKQLLGAIEELNLKL